MRGNTMECISSKNKYEAYKFTKVSAQSTPKLTHS